MVCNEFVLHLLSPDAQLRQVLEQVLVHHLELSWQHTQ